MRGLIVAWLTAFLLCVGAGHAVARRPSASPTPPGQRFEVPEAGLALTFPADWGIGILMSPFALAPAELAGADVEMSVILTAAAPDRRDGRCAVLLFQGGALTADAFAEMDGAWITDAPGWKGTIESTPMQIPAGEAIRIDVETDEPAGRLDFIGDAAFATDLVLAADDGILVLMCRSMLPTEDHWVSIAETLEFLPTETYAP